MNEDRQRFEKMLGELDTAFVQLAKEYTMPNRLNYDSVTWRVLSLLPLAYKKMRETEELENRSSKGAKGKSVRLATSLDSWVNECTVSSDGVHTNAARLHDSYVRWCERNTLLPIGGNKFYTSLESLYRKERLGGRSFYMGIALLEDEEDYTPPLSDNDLTLLKNFLSAFIDTLPKSIFHEDRTVFSFCCMARVAYSHGKHNDQSLNMYVKDVSWCLEELGYVVDRSSRLTSRWTVVKPKPELPPTSLLPPKQNLNKEFITAADILKDMK